MPPDTAFPKVCVRPQTLYRIHDPCYRTHLKDHGFLLYIYPLHIHRITIMTLQGHGQVNPVQLSRQSIINFDGFLGYEFPYR